MRVAVCPIFGSVFVLWFKGFVVDGCTLESNGITEKITRISTKQATFRSNCDIHKSCGSTVDSPVEISPRFYRSGSFFELPDL